MKELYCTPFVFRATQYEEHQNGRCTSHGKISVQIISKVINGYAMFHIEGALPMAIKRNFGIPVLGIKQGDLLEDRIQYGRLPNSMSWSDSTDPLVCNIFENRTCIRFAMLSPLRIVEFMGYFELIGE